MPFETYLHHTCTYTLSCDPLLDSEMLFSMYSLSLVEMRGCFAGLSNPKTSQNANHDIPIAPTKILERYYIIMVIYYNDDNYIIMVIYCSYTGQLTQLTVCHQYPSWVKAVDNTVTMILTEYVEDILPSEISTYDC